MVSEVEIEQYLRVETKYKLDLGECYKFTSPNRKFVLDRLIVAREVIAFIEVKGPQGWITSGQAREAKRLRKKEHIALFIWSKHEVEQLLKTLRRVQNAGFEYGSHLQSFKENSEYYFDFGERAIPKGASRVKTHL